MLERFETRAGFVSNDRAMFAHDLVFREPIGVCRTAGSGSRTASSATSNSSPTRARSRPCSGHRLATRRRSSGWRRQNSRSVYRGFGESPRRRAATQSWSP